MHFLIQLSYQSSHWPLQLPQLLQHALSSDMSLFIRNNKSRNGNIKSYLYKLKILGSPMCCCTSGEQTVDHILFECKLLEQERGRLKAAILRSENWPVCKNILINEYNKYFMIFTNSI
jgi:hypothetical protein